MSRAGTLRRAAAPRGGRRLPLLALAMLLATTARADVIFHVPEVLVRHAAVPRPVGSAPPPPAPRNDSEWAGGAQERFEYFVEHAISTSDAKKMALMLRVSDMAETLPGCGACSARDREYCESKVLADHCCCERRYVPEPFPWLPHTCYMGPERCTPLAQNCAHYARLRDCCCMKTLASHWKGILSRATKLSISGVVLLVLSTVIFSIYL